MPKSLDKQLAEYLKEKRGDMGYTRFSKLTGVAPMTLYRIEKREMHLSLDKLETIIRKLKIKLSDIFPEEF